MASVTAAKLGKVIQGQELDVTSSSSGFDNGSLVFGIRQSGGELG